MALSFSRNKNSLRRMKAGLSRLVGTIETMKENLNNQEEEYEYVWEYEEDDSTEELEEDELPEAVVADVRREEATVAAEQAQLAQWRSELEGILKAALRTHATKRPRSTRRHRPALA
jgi:hypothetical protein